MRRQACTHDQAEGAQVTGQVGTQQGHSNSLGSTSPGQVPGGPPRGFHCRAAQEPPGAPYQHPAGICLLQAHLTHEHMANTENTTPGLLHVPQCQAG